MPYRLANKQRKARYDSRYRAIHCEKLNLARMERYHKQVSTEVGRREFLYKFYKSRKKHQVKYAARQRLKYAIRTGKIKRGPCRDCGSMDSFGHHDDYNKALEVIWLCRKHHGIIHRKFK